MSPLLEQFHFFIKPNSVVKSCYKSLISISFLTHEQERWMKTKNELTLNKVLVSLFKQKKNKHRKN